MEKDRIVWAAIVSCIVLAVATAMIIDLEKRKQVQKTETGKQYQEIFGENVYIFGPQDKPEQVQEILDELWEKQEANQFGSNRYAIFFLPGRYDESIEVKIGYYMEAAGLGILPEETTVKSIRCDARWLGDEKNHNATCNFWRGVENLTVDGDMLWAVSQAAFLRRMNIKGSLRLHDDYGWASGGFLADSRVENLIDSGTQQQWLTRNSDFGMWMGQNWNMVFVGNEEGKAPKGTWPGTRYTTVEKTPVIREKPFLIYTEGEFGVFIPALRKNCTGISWKDGSQGEIIPINEFYVAKAEIDTADTINQALSEGRHLLLTPGIYDLEKPIEIKYPNTVVLGMGLATLRPVNGNIALYAENKEGIQIAGILFDAGEKESETLLKVGADGCRTWQEQEPIILSDLFFRVGGAAPYDTAVKSCVKINASDVVGDHFWVWRADHGEGVGWENNTAQNGIIINGNHVTMYALMVEHFQEYQTVWNGEYGRTYFYQCEIPYDISSQEVWKSHDGNVNGYASYYVKDDVTNHEGWGLGIYSYHRDAEVDLDRACELPEAEGVELHNVCVVMITGNPGISHIVNQLGKAVTSPGQREIIREYGDGKVLK